MADHDVEVTHEVEVEAEPLDGGTARHESGSKEVRRLIKILRDAPPGAKGVLVVVDGDSYSVDEFGEDVGGWEQVLGILQCGIAYCSKAMFDNDGEDEYEV